jgi:hypothetical protein
VSSKSTVRECLRKKVDSIEWEKTPEGVHIKGYKGSEFGNFMPEDVFDNVNAALRRNDQLGFDTLSEARRGLLGDGLGTAWLDRWDMRGAPAEDIAAMQDYIDEKLKKTKELVADTRYAENDLTEVLGKVMADRIRNDPNQTGVIEGENLTVDSVGVKKLYDVVVPAQANKILKELGGGKVGEISVPTKDSLSGGEKFTYSRYADLSKPEGEQDFVVNRITDEVVAGPFKNSDDGSKWLYANDPALKTKQQGFDITPALRERAMQGMPKFSVAPRINTDAFKRWFGDSKVVDENGDPLVVYHGSANFKGYKFEPSQKANRTGNPDGYYFTYDLEDANNYAGNKDGAEIIPVFLSIKNPYAYGGKHVHSRDMVAQFEKELRKDNLNLNDDWISGKVKIFSEGRFPNITFPTDAMTRVIQAGGFDGMKDGRDWVAFSPNQIKSAIGNTGAFDSTNPDIRRSVAPRIAKNIVKNNEGYWIYKGELPESFYKWFGNSVATDKDGYPKVMFHGTARDITEFKPKQANSIFVTDDEEFAEDFSEMSRSWMLDHIDQFVTPERKKELETKARKIEEADSSKDEDDEFFRLIKDELPSDKNIMPLFVRAEKPFDYSDKTHLAAVRKELEKNSNFSKQEIDLVLDTVQKGSWRSIEREEVQDAIKAVGFDGFYAKEAGRVNLAVYDPNQVKSVTGNSGEYSRESKDIRRSVAPKFAVKIAKGDNLNISKKVDEVGAYLDSITGEKLDWNDPKNLKQAVDKGVVEIKYMLSTQNNGLDWYEEDVAKAFEETAKKIPELKSETARRLFSTMSGIMSPQTNARDNWFIASKAFAHYVDTGVIPGNNPETGGLWQGGTTSLNKKKQLDMLDAMVRDMTEEGAVNWLFSTHTTRELNEFRKKYGNMGGTGEALSLESLGLRAFGPKVGPFVMNLNGIYEITVDMWMTRTANRWFGQVVDGNKKIVDAPTEPFRRVVKELVKDIASSTGIKPYQVQSVLWFFEQSLYRKLGTYAESYGFSDGAKRYSDEGAPRGGQMVRRGNENADGGNKRKESGENLSVAQKPEGGGKQSVAPRITRIPGDTAYDIPNEPGSTPIKEGYIRLYHQTEEDNLRKIEKEGLLLKHAKGIEGPRAIYAGESPFYGKSDSRPTLEFQVPKKYWDSPFVLRDVTPEDIIAAHYPWHRHARYLEDEEGIINVLSGRFDYLDKDDGKSPNETKALRYIKAKYELSSKQSIAPKFSTARTVGATKRPYTPEQLKYFSETGRTIEIPTLRERIQALFKNFSSNLAQGIADQFDPLKKLDPMAYLLARMSKGSSGALESLLKYGKLKIRGGLLYDADRSGGFLENVVMPMKGEFEDFLWWVAANRAGTLFGKDKENLFSPDNIIAGKALQNGTLTFSYKLSNGTTTTSRADMFKDSLNKYNAFNRNVLDMAEQSGLIDGSTRNVWEQAMYVPFFRVSEDQKGFIGQGIKKGLVRQAAFKTLKGGTNKLNSDLMSNVLQNWYHLIDASAKNRASNRALDVAVATGAAQAASESTIRSMGKSLDMRSGVVWDMRNGHKQYYLVEDQAVIEALTALEPANIPGPMMKGLHAFKYYLTLGVTISPYYKVRNLIRDSVQSVAVSDLSYNVLTNWEEGYAASDRKSQDYVTMLASGAVIRFGTSMEGNESGRVRALVNSGVKDSTILDSPGKIKSFFDKLRPLTEMYSDIGSRGEEINRAALYKRVLEKLTSQGMPSDEAHAQAAFLARDLMDFSMQGSWGTIRFLTQVVPFMNSRIQGLYKLGRAAKQDKARVAIVIGAASLLGLTLMAMFKDDDDWKKRTDADRNNYWWFKFGGIAYRIPKPFEVGAISTVAERGWELFFDNEMTGKRFSKNIESLLLDNLAMNPVPQVFKPLLDVYSNKDAHSGIPIETMGMEKLLPEFRFTSETTAPAKALSTIAMGTLSPVQIDHMIKGYFGWLGTFVVGGADMGVNLVTSGPAKPSIDIISKISGGMVRTLPEKQSRYVNQIYEQAKELEQVYGTQQYLLHKRKIEEYREFTEEHKDELRKYRLIEPIKKLESALNKRIRQVEDNTTKDSDTKRVEINALNQRRDQLARRLSARFQ